MRPRQSNTPGRHGGRLVPALVVVMAMAAAACGRGTAPPRVEARADVARADTGSTTADLAVRATDALAADLYRRLSTTDGNLVFSPTSIEVALAMARTGARGQTRTQMDTVLGAPAGQALDDSINALDLALASRSGTRGLPGRQGQVSLSVADQLWGQQGLHFEPGFLDGLARDYGAGMKQVDYVDDSDGARRAINTWASDQTHGRIRDLIPQGGLDRSTALVLANAVYLKAPWDTEFSAPTPQPFHRSGATTRNVPTMSGGEGGSYGQGAGWQAAEIPYLGDQLSMVVIVPDDLSSFEGSLDGARLAAITSGLHQPLLDVDLPTFTFGRSFSLAEQLAALGMPLAFSPDADFSGMTTQASLLISKVLHQAYIGVDQHGTEAAAATAVVAEPTAALPGEHLVVDRPFLFAIRDRQTGAILFLGRVTDPTSST